MSTLGEFNLLTQPTGVWNTDIERYNQGLLMTAPNIADYSVAAGGLGNYGTYNDIGLDKNAYTAMANAGATEGLDKNLLGGYGADTLDWLKGQNAAGLAGLAGTGFSIYDSLWGTGANLRQAQIDLLNQQVAYNKDAMADKNKFQANVASGANAGTAAGLAASASK